MSFIADGLLIAGALTAAFYCWILSVRVKGLKDLDTGLGSAIASLSNQVNEMQTALRKTQAVTGDSITEMENLADRAEAASDHLRLMLATVEKERDRDAKRKNVAKDEPKTEEQPSQTGRVKKFPTKKSKTENWSEADDQISSSDEFKDKLEQSRALKLKQEVAERIRDRDTPSERDDLVQALQDILAANK